MGGGEGGWKLVWLLPLPVPGVLRGRGGARCCHKRQQDLKDHLSCMRVVPGASLGRHIPGDLCSWGGARLHQPPHPCPRLVRQQQFEALGAAQFHGRTSPRSACSLRPHWVCKGRRLGCHSHLCLALALCCATSPGGASVSTSVNGRTEHVLQNPLVRMATLVKCTRAALTGAQLPLPIPPER